MLKIKVIIGDSEENIMKLLLLLSPFIPLTIIFMVFVTLKLSGGITWSWWWVLSPMLVMLAVCIIAGILFVGACLLTSAIWRDGFM